MPVSQWVMLDCSLSWHSAQHWLSNRNTQYIRNMFEDWGAISRKRCIWYGVGVNRWPIGNHPSFMLYRLARSRLTQRDWKVKDRFGLVRSANSAQAQSLLLCLALSYSALSWEAPRKSWGHSKKNSGVSAGRSAGIYAPHFWNASGATALSSVFFFFASYLWFMC